MIMTKKELKRIQEDLRIAIPSDIEKELLDQYGHPVQDDKGHVFEYTEQDIYEQIRKLLR